MAEWPLQTAASTFVFTPRGKTTKNLGQGVGTTGLVRSVGPLHSSSGHLGILVLLVSHGKTLSPGGFRSSSKCCPATKPVAPRRVPPHPGVLVSGPFHSRTRDTTTPLRCEFPRRKSSDEAPPGLQQRSRSLLRVPRRNPRGTPSASLLRFVPPSLWGVVNL